MRPFWPQIRSWDILLSAAARLHEDAEAKTFSVTMDEVRRYPVLTVCYPMFLGYELRIKD